jgi:hypothetical protein
MGSIILMAIVFGLGAYFGKKYPEKVDQATDFGKKTFNTIKEKLGSKKEAS